MNPQINALEVFAVPTEPLDSPLNKQMMRVTTTLTLTHSDGYVLFSVGRTEAQLEGHARLENVDHHSKYYYRFYDAPLGRPIGGDETKGQLYDDSEGVFIREFTNGWAVYNRSGKAQQIEFREMVSGVASGVEEKHSHVLPDLDGEIYLKSESGLETPPTADVNGDGIVNILDLVILDLVTVANAFDQ